ncbi:hypothetical protein BDW66DRAFT_25857 [Aspergillus desertorum]
MQCCKCHSQSHPECLLNFESADRMLCGVYSTVSSARLLSSICLDRVSNYQVDLARGYFNLELVGERSCLELTLLVYSQLDSVLGYMQTPSACCWGLNLP